MRRFYAPMENFDHNKISLDSEQSRHLRNVLRLQPGDEILVFDGVGNEFRCLVQEFSSNKKTCFVKSLEKIEPTKPESNLDSTLAVSLLKGDKFDLAIQKAVELGVTKFVPIITKRCDVKLRNEEKKLERWKKIIIEASKQCGRAKLMEITKPFEFEELVETAQGSKVLFSERNGVSFSEINPAEKVTAIIGSEGGWEDSELEFAEKNSCQIVTLGGRILRAETAVISIASILQNCFGDMN